MILALPLAGVSVAGDGETRAPEIRVSSAAVSEESKPRVPREELRRLLAEPVSEAKELDTKLRRVFELSDENSSLRLRG